MQSSDHLGKHEIAISRLFEDIKLAVIYARIARQGTWHVFIYCMISTDYFQGCDTRISLIRSRSREKKIPDASTLTDESLEFQL
jgi:hypothetical protein